MKFRLHRLAAAVVLLQALTMGRPATAQETDRTKPPRTGSQRPGRFRLGPIYLTPRLRIGSIGLDTNVLYTSRDRRADITGSGGPQLEIVFPLKGDLRLLLDGGATYIYFVRTASERRLVGDGRARLEWPHSRTQAAIEASVLQTFARPSPEVDRRLDQRQETLRAELRFPLVSRFSLALAAATTRHEVEPGQEFLGIDLHRTLSRDTRTGLAALEYVFTVKTKLAFQGEVQRNEFVADPSRDGDLLRGTAGVYVNSNVFLSGHLVGGLRWHRDRSGTNADQQAPYADCLLTWHVSPRTHLGLGYARDLAYTALLPVDGQPTSHTETFTVQIDKDLRYNLDLRLLGRRATLRTDSAVRLTTPDGQAIAAIRSDVLHEGTADLGYRFRPRFRIGILAGYTDRESTIADLGVRGLLIGGTVLFTP
jgi:hypothetical protein